MTKCNQAISAIYSCGIIAYLMALHNAAPTTHTASSQRDEAEGLRVTSEPVTMQPNVAGMLGVPVDAKVTAYCPCRLCCGSWSKNGKTAIGRDAGLTRGVAVDFSIIPKNSIVGIPGYGYFLADDTGGAMRKSAKKGIVHIDLRFNDHNDALKFGVKHMTIYVEKP